MTGRLLAKVLLRSSVLFVMILVWAGVCAADSSLINCDINSHACSQSMGERQVELDISPKPVTAMEELTFRVVLTGPAPAESPFIDLGMPGMKMGPNRVDLEKTGDSTYEGKGVIVRCPSGKTIWRATVTIPKAGPESGSKAGSSDFIFDVAY